MTDNIINLNRFRKAKARAADQKLAAENRVKFGRTKPEKQAAKAEAERIAARHDGLKLDDPGKPE